MILVTGASGLVGGEVARILAAAGAPFRAGYRSQEKLARARGAGQAAVAVDFSRPGLLASALEGVTALFLASSSSPDQTDLEIAVVRAARAAGVPRIVKLSVWDAPGEAFTFARLHRPVEVEIEASGMSFRLVRPNGFMQNITTHMADEIRAHGTISLPAGDARVSHVDARDVAAVAAAALLSSSPEAGSCDPSGPEALTYGDMAAVLGRVGSRPIAYVELDEAAYGERLLAAGASAWLVEAVLDLTRYYRSGRAARVTAVVRQATGREPVSFLQHVRAFPVTAPS
ncbi:MAG: NmrA family NAD(P)-binding protein [Candidatus Polarisedimenticolia bacterium]